jgi:NAD(P)-dependent dehydrogenase (short-subunit alcohol dehydrogenase family)
MDTQTIEELVDLTGKAAVVVGGAMGIGQMIANALAKSGAAVMIADGNADAAHHVVEEIGERGGYAEAMLADACNAEDAVRVAQVTVDRMGSLDILVNTAATFSFSRTLPQVESLWSRVLSAHVKGVYYYCDAVAREMIRAGRGGRIVNIASMEAMRPPAQPASNGATDNGVAVLSKAVALKFGSYGIRANALAPSLAEPPIVQVQMASLAKSPNQSLEAISRETQSRLTVDQIRGADDLVTAVLFLVSDAAADVTGNLVVVG